MRRGDVYWAELNPRSGSEQKGRRPVIVVTDDGFNLAEGWRSIIVVPLSTSASQARRSVTTVEIPAGSAGLTRAGIAICHQVTTLDRGKLLKRLGTLPIGLMTLVNEALKAAMDLD
jgi:mRNA interferase MazF